MLFSLRSDFFVRGPPPHGIATAFPSTDRTRAGQSCEKERGIHYRFYAGGCEHKEIACLPLLWMEDPAQPPGRAQEKAELHHRVHREDGIIRHDERWFVCQSSKMTSIRPSRFLSATAPRGDTQVIPPAVLPASAVLMEAQIIPVMLVCH